MKKSQWQELLTLRLRINNATQLYSFVELEKDYNEYYMISKMTEKSFNKWYILKYGQ